MPAPRLPPRLPVAVVTALACGPAFAANGPLGDVAVGFVTGAAMAIAGTMFVAWTVLRDRIARRRTWVPYVVAAALLMLAGAWHAGDQGPWLVIAGLGVLAWGLGLVFWLAGRMLRLLQERDHARAEMKQVKRDSERDALTGVLNRGAWRSRLEQLSEDMTQAGRPLSVLFFDIDLFKLVNDSLGHAVGDDCLKAVARTVAEELRGGDVLGRLGGEEFAVILPTAKRIHAIAVAERIRTAVQKRCQVVGEEHVELTVSVGAAEYLGPDEHLDALMERADRSMYNAKDSGRNIVVADLLTPPNGTAAA
jgi:diguanylate cyclase (GGDEF)-like protein